jgi:trehalose 6-phosphate phosphatase
MREILQAFRPGARVLLFLDYDGTLVPIRRTPEEAVLSASHRRFLERLARRTFVCVVSGRSLPDLRRRVGARGVAYIGNHGLEIRDGRVLWIHPDAERLRPVLGSALAAIRRETRGIPGLLVEDKGVTASVHYRLADPRRYPGLKETIEREVGKRGRRLKLTEGKKVIEIRPNVPWDKGRGVRELVRRRRFDAADVRAYIGDDRTDEDAFRALRRDDVTVAVGRGRPSGARFRLPDVDAVWNLLRALARMPRLRGPGTRGRPRRRTKAV